MFKIISFKYHYFINNIYALFSIYNVNNLNGGANV